MKANRHRCWLPAVALGLCLIRPGAVAAYEGNLRFVFGDIKRAMAGIEGSLNTSNCQTIVSGIKNNLHCNGLRVYIDPDIADPAAYPQLYKDVVNYARSQGLHLYANPLGTGTFGKTKAQWAKWIARYANFYRPRYLGPFNESAWNAADTKTIVDDIRSRLAYSPVLVGPDKQKSQDTISFLGKSPSVISKFDVIGAHNAADDAGATPWAWWRLRQVAGRATWATENPRPWSESNANGVEVGVKAVVDTAGPIEGLGIYLAYPYCVNAEGTLSAKGLAIANGIGAAPDNWLSISTASALPGGTAGSACTVALQAAHGTVPYTWSLVAGSLPAGLTFSTGGVISGTPDASTNASFRVRVTDGELLSTERDFRLGIAPPAWSTTVLASPGNPAPSDSSVVLAVSAPGITEFGAGWSATIQRGEQRYVLESINGVRDGTTIHFPEAGIDLLFRLDELADAPAVLAQAGILNTGKEPLRLIEIVPLEGGFRVAGEPAQWRVTRLDSSVVEAPPVMALSEMAAPQTVHEYGGVYRQDGVGFFFGPAGTPVAYVNARIRHVGEGRVTFRVAADMSGVRVDPGQMRWGQQVALLLEPPSRALPRWASWVAQSHGARAVKPALAGWNTWSSWWIKGEKDSVRDLLKAVDAVQQSGGRLQPSVVQLDDDFRFLADGLIASTNAFPELASCAQRISASGARPGLRIEFSEANYPAAKPSPADVALSLQHAVQAGFTYVKLYYPLAGSQRGDTQTSFEAVRQEYAAIRNAIGEETYLLHCGGKPDRAVVGFADVSRTGTDATREKVAQAATDALRSYFLQSRWFTADNDAYYIGTDVENISQIAGGWPLVRTWMSMVGLSCGTAITSDPWHWDSFRPYWRNVEVMTPPARERTDVLDLCTGREWPRLVGHVTRPWGDWTVALLWNPSATTEQNITLDFAQAGLDPRRRYAVWSFWNNRYLGVAEGQWTTPRLAPLACEHIRLTDLDRRPGKPVVIGSSLHIYCGAAEIRQVTALASGMEIELTDAGAREGDLFVYSRRPLLMRKATGCRVVEVAGGGENVWRIALEDRQHGKPQRIELEILLPVTRQPWFWALVAAMAASAGFAGWRYAVGLRLEQRQALTEERARIARDMHDEIGSKLARLSMLGEITGEELAANPEDRGRVREITRGIREAAGELEHVIWSLNPKHDRLDEVAHRICKEAEEFFADTPVQCRFASMPELPPLTTPPGARAAVLRVVKEALANILKHADATTADIALRVEQGVFEVCIADNGRGFDPSQPAPTSGGNGLSNMRERMARLGGECRIESAPGRGTTVTLRLALARIASKG